MDKWLPVLRSSYDSWLGVMPNGTLGIGKEHEARGSLQGSGYVGMWPFLERSLATCLEDFTAGWHLLGGRGVSTPERLVELTVSSACERARPYWVALAVGWLAEMAQSNRFDAQLVAEMLRLATVCEGLPAPARAQAKAALAD